MATDTFTYPSESRLHANLFRPPESPAFASRTPTYSASTPDDYFSTSTRSRKRQRPDSSHGLNDNQHTPSVASGVAQTPGWTQCPSPSDTMYGSAYAHSSAMVNERYTLKGGLDTPGIMSMAQDDNVAMGARDTDLRRRTRDGDVRRTIGGAPVTGPLARERNGVARMPSSPNGSQGEQQGWTRFAFGLVGKAFTFGTSVIRGFYAGAGQGYDLQHQALEYSPHAWIRRGRYVSGSTPVPGAWKQDEDFLGDFEQDNPTYSPSSAPSATRPSNKRRQTDKESWVMVGTPEREGVDTTPKRKASSQNMSRLSTASRPNPASRAHSRRSIAPVSRRASSHATHTLNAGLTPTTTDTSNRRASHAPTRSPHISRPSSSGQHVNAVARRGSGATEVQMSPEVERYVKRQAKQEKAADRTMNSMNRKLAEMIQQAQAALGTKYAVEGDGGRTMDDEEFEMEDTDEGFVDEAW